MIEDGKWGLPRLFDGQIELQKPPLFYWMVATTGWLRGGVDAIAVRIPAAATAVMGLGFIWLLLARCCRPHAAILACCILMTSLHYTTLARTGRIDMPLAVAITACLIGYYQSWRVLAYCAAAVAVLLKGPIGVILPLSVIAVHQLVEYGWPKWDRMRASGWWWGIPLVMAIALPWYIWVNHETDGAFFRVFFGKHNLERGFGGGSLTSHPWWFYGPRFLFDFLPWSLILPLAITHTIRSGWWREDALLRLGAIWLGTMIGVLSCAGFKRADYLLPAYPGAALFLACVGERWLAARPRAATGAFASVLVALSIGWIVYLHGILPHENARLDSRPFAARIRELAPRPQLVLFFRAEAHALAFHVDRPIDTILEWENLDVWVGRPQQYHVVMPPDCAEDWQRHLKQGTLEEICRTTEPASRPWVLMRTRPMYP